MKRRRFGTSRSIEEYVGRLQIAMHNSLLVRVVDGSGEDRTQLRRQDRIPGIVADDLGQVASFDELHREVRRSLMTAQRKNLNDVRVLQPRDRFRLGAKPLMLNLSRMTGHEDHLERDRAFQLSIASSIDNTHSAVAKSFLDDVSIDPVRRGADCLTAFALKRLTVVNPSCIQHAGTVAVISIRGRLRIGRADFRLALECRSDDVF